MNTDSDTYTHTYTYKNFPYKIFLITQLTHYKSFARNISLPLVFGVRAFTLRKLTYAHTYILLYIKCLYVFLLCGKSHHVEALEKTAIFQLTAAFNAATCHIK